MLVSLDQMVERYARLEMAVQQRMNACCAVFCSACTTPCCRIDFCCESLESPFLAAVRNRFAPAALWDPAAGWLTPTGCGLAAGRPPVCYEFLCGPILTAQTNVQPLSALKRLSMLITAAGRRARGNHHLVELSDLSRINPMRLLAQLDRSQAALTRLLEQWGEFPCNKDIG